jgi:hypothetical protein
MNLFECNWLVGWEKKKPTQWVRLPGENLFSKYWIMFWYSSVWPPDYGFAVHVFGLSFRFLL